MGTYWKAIQNNEKQSTKNDARFARIYILRLFVFQQNANLIMKETFYEKLQRVFSAPE